MKKIEHYMRHAQKLTPLAVFAPEREKDRAYMEQCLALAREAAAQGEVPVGALVVEHGESGDRILSMACNTRQREQTALGHAELNAIDAACRARGSWRLHDCTLYVTLEPCPMCAGALIGARIGRVVYGAKDSRAGALGSVLNLKRYPLESKPEVTIGVCEEECRTLLFDFFEGMRQKK